MIMSIKFDFKMSIQHFISPYILIIYLVTFIVKMVSSVDVNLPDDMYQSESLKIVNELRAKHKAQPVQLAPELNEAAEKCANWYLDTGKLNHLCPHKKGVPNFGWVAGENIMKMSGVWYPPWQSCVKSAQGWYAEIAGYDFPNNQCKKGEVCGHFTQVVWNSTTKVGMGFAKRGRNQVVVGLYHPHGNFPPYRRNVFPPV